MEGENALIRHDFEFRGSGREYFGIWIVNLALSLITFGIYSAWAKVRTQRYLYGNTYVAGHSLDYDPSPWRILIGRIIAVSAFLAYSVAVGFWPQTIGLFYIGFGLLIPWLINSSLRFSARNTLYRNIRFDFVGRYSEALVNYVIWPIVGYVSLFLLLPRARKARDYYYINKHAYGGRPFQTSFSTGRIYLIYLGGVALFLGLGALLVAVSAWADAATGDFKTVPFGDYLGFAVLPLYFIVYTAAVTFIDIMVFNLTVNHTTFDERHKLASRVSPWMVTWIVVTNFLLTLLTIGLFYPFGRVRLTRYQTERLSLMAASDLDEYTSELSRANSAIGEEVAGFFDLGIGL
ncbi:MAG TPA: YjgN family protein [Rhizomicrobium sp.]|jgi:uncharacterized membrane protein YjgN (DUF898 family)